MARPDVHVDLQYEGEWHDIIEDVRIAETITVARGRRDWATVADPATASMMLNQGASNVAPGTFGRYAPRNPVSDLYGLIGRNTGLRVRIGEPRPRIRLPGYSGSAAVVFAPPSFDFAAGLTVAVDLKAADWTPGDGRYRILACQWPDDDGNRGWVLYVGPDGEPWFSWTSDGGSAGRVTVGAGVPLPLDAGRTAIRAHLVADDGTGASVVAFATGPTVDGPWSTLAVVEDVASSVYPSTAPLALGASSDGRPGLDGTGAMLAADVFALKVTDAVGAVVVDVDTSGLDPADEAFTDTTGLDWLLVTFCYVTDPAVRLSGEIATWPQAWDLSGAVRWSSVTSAGILRRLQKHTSPIRSSLFRDLSTKANVVAYYPLEEPSGAVRFGSGRSGDTTFLRSFRDVTAAAYDGFTASEPLPTVANGNINGTLPSYTPDADQRFIYLTRIPDDGLSGEKLIARWLTTGTVRLWDLYYDVGGLLGIKAYDADGVQLQAQYGNFGIDGVEFMASLWLSQNGPDTDWQLAVFRLGSGATVTENTVTGHDYGRFTYVYLGSTHDVEGTAYGHAAILNGDVHSVWDTVGSSLVAWSGEQAGQRLQRLAIDEGIPMRIRGADTATMGPQRPLTVLELMREAPSADFGHFGDAHDTPAVAYRPRQTLYGQTPALTLDFAAGQLSEPFQPIDDDQATVNAVTVTNALGDTFTLEIATGPVSTAPPPLGVGRYDTSREVNTDGPAELADIAGWILALGTVDEPRYPVIRLNLQHPAVAPFAADVLDVVEGDVIRVDNLPAGGPTGPVLGVVDAIADEIGPVMHIVEFTTAPGSPWTDVRAYGDAAARYETAGTVLVNDWTTGSAAFFDVETTDGPVWTTDAAAMPFDVTAAGVRLRVTAVSAPYGGTFQSFTVEPDAVNGIHKTIPAGSAVHLADPTRYAL